MTKKYEYTAAEILGMVRPTPTIENGLSDAEKIERIQKHFSEIMTILGLDLTNDSLRDTPKRVAKMYVSELFSGLRQDNFPSMTVLENDMGYDQMVIEKNINVKSVCEHHFVTIDGFCHVAYIPRQRVIGLSKLNRIVEYFSKRPQVQERLTKQIADCLEHVLDTRDVAVYIDAKHYCVISRGVEDQNSRTITSDLRGEFRNSGETRMEFMKACQGYRD